MPSPQPRTLFEKVWDAHLVEPEAQDRPAVLYVDLHLIHEVTSPQAFQVLKERGLKVRRPGRTFATLDHSTPTNNERSYVSEEAESQVRKLEENCREHGIALEGWDSDNRGVVHVMAPELGLTLPGSVVVCGDSHTATHGAFGALAFGIGTSEVGHVLATQCLLQRRPKTLRVTVDGKLQPGVGAKDLALAIIAALGTGGGTGSVVEYTGEAIHALDMEGRMTVCNMSIELGARAGMIAPDATTIAWLKGRKHAPKDFDAAAARWTALASDDGAQFDREIHIHADMIEPMATWGTTPDTGIAIGTNVPGENKRALDYMGMEAGQRIEDAAVDVVFIGSCTNGRLSDLRTAAAVLRGRKVSARVRALIVPGSEAVKRAAEAEGLHEIFLAAGAEWRQPGCSMCIAMNGDIVAPGQLAVSTSNRNFEGRQGPGARTVLASPATAAASALEGHIADPRPYLEAAHG
ncbi:MAG TPA: 3-isopropylmalate dehydratase large subunit [Rhizomicrobium sp.]|jgi:3-isopropylmalate/(R)-2-methylmalate dehydratase large subunit